MDINVTLRFTDSGSGQAVKALQSITGAAEKGGAATQKVTDAQSKAAQGADNLARSGKAAAQAVSDTARAAAQLDRASAAGLDRGLRNVTTSAKNAGQAVKTLGGNIKSAMQGMAQVTTGVAAAGATLYMAAKKPMDTELRFARMADTAFPDRKDLAGRKAGAQELRAATVNAVRQGGGSIDEAAESLNSLIASNVVEAEAAKSMLPVIQKFASSSGASSNDIAQIAIAGIKQKFFAPEQLEQALNKALVGGKEGSFELKDMARHLPVLMSSSTGMNSMQGFERIIASMQGAMAASSSPDTAANNLKNLFAAMSSSRLSEMFNKKLNIDLPGSLAKAREKGAFSLDAVVGLVQKEVVNKNPAFKATMERAKNAKGPDKAEHIKAAANMLEGSAIGHVFTDQEARLQLLAEMSQRDYIQGVNKKLKNADGAVELDFAHYQSTTFSSVQRATNEKDIAMQGAFDKASPAIKDVTDTASGAARENPDAAVLLAALGVVGATAMASGAAYKGVGMLMSGTAAAVPGAAAAKPGKMAGRVLKSLGAVGAAMEVHEAWQTETDPALTRAEKNKTHAGMAGGWAGAWAGAKGGGAFGASVAGPYGAIAGGIGGAIGGYFMGQSLAKFVYGDPKKESKDTLSRGELSSIIAEFGQEVRGIKPEANVTVMLDGREVAAHVAERLGYDFRRGGN